jgi:4-amino-4-deoxy-L-arabinose transferase-like glycosyltransferase
LIASSDILNLLGYSWAVYNAGGSGRLKDFTLRQGFWRTHYGLIGLLALFMAGVLAEHIVLPVMEGGDEYLHYNYVQYLLRENRLPERATYLTNSMQQQSGQPPLVYWTAAMLMRMAGMQPDDDQALWARFGTHKNPWYAPPDPWNRTDNRNLFFHSGEGAFETPTIERIVRVMRFSGLIFGLLAVIGAYGAAKEVFERESWALTATAIFAFTPQLIHVSSFTNTDSGMIAFTALTTWATLRLLRLGATPWRCIVIGLLLALAGLSKVSGLLIAPGVGVALLLDAYKRRLSLWQLVVNGVLVGLPLLMLFAPWMAYGYSTYNDPLGTTTHLRPGYFYDQPLNLVDLLPLLPEVYLGYWGKLASAIYLHPLTYTALGVILALSIGGYAAWIWGRRGRNNRLQLNNLQVQQVIVLGTIIVVSLIGLIHWLQTIHFITGRLMFQAHAAVAILITGGLYLLAWRFRGLTRPLQLYSSGVVIAAGVLLTPISIYTAYAPPQMLTATELPTLMGQPADFEGMIRFLGYTQDSAILEGNLHPITLCWEVLEKPTRPAAFSVKFVRDGNIVADRTSVHGMGRYDSGQWQPGDRWCDPVDVPITGTLEPGQTYDILLVLLDGKTGAVDWQATTMDGTPIQYPFIGQVTSP